jgi:hypothetical protein
MPSCLVYGLASSEAPATVRYIGKTTLAPKVRLNLHLSAAKRSARTAVHRWIVSHLRRGNDILMLPLVDGANWDGDEERVISEYRASGASLMNILPGGQGTLGLRHTDEERMRRSERRKGKALPPETRAKVSASLKGHQRSLEAREKQRRSVMGSANHFHGKSHTAAAKEANGRARVKLTDEQVLEARASFAAGEPQKSIAARLGISQAQVSAIVNGKAYRWLANEGHAAHAAL